MPKAKKAPPSADHIQPPQEAPNRQRLQFDFHPAQVVDLDRLVEVYGASSRAEVIRRALHLLKVATAAKEKGGGMAIYDSNDNYNKIMIL